tara:strand:- start:12 stop:617 length:606 start_codon:yes stop_codon:yes gene_type:complete
MANNFFNKIVRNVSADGNAPTAVYTVPASKKTIVIELDVSNRSTASQTISVEVEDFSQKGSAVTLTNGTSVSSNTLTSGTAHNLNTGDRIEFTHVTGLSGVATGKQYWVIKVAATTFKVASTHANATAGTALTVTGTQSGSNSLNLLYYIYIVRDAPIPIGGALKVIAGQKLVLEASDKLLCTASSASTVDCIASILEDVS